MSRRQIPIAQQIVRADELIGIGRARRTPAEQTELDQLEYAAYQRHRRLFARTTRLRERLAALEASAAALAPPEGRQPLPRTLPAALRQLRLERGWSKKDAAEAAGCLRPEISYYESGKRVPTVEKLALIARAYGDDSGYLAALRDNLHSLAFARLRARYDATANRANAAGGSL